MSDSASYARSNPACPLLGLLLRSLSISTLRRRYPISCALQVGNGVLPRLRLVRFLRGPCAALLSRMVALSCFQFQIKRIQQLTARLREPSCANLGGAWN